MNLTEVLLSQPQSELVSRVKAMGVSCNLYSRQELAESLINELLNEELALQKWEKLEPAGQQLLLPFVYCTFHYSFTDSELITFINKSERGKFESLITTLKENGWIYKTEKGGWLLPDELRRKIHSFVCRKLSDTFIYIPVSKNDSTARIINDLFLFMEYLEERPVKLSKNKIINKRELEKILNLLSMGEKPPEEQWRFGYGRYFNYYPDCFSLLYDFVFSQGWISEAGDKLAVTEKWEAGQNLSLNEILDRLMRLYISVYKRAVPSLPFIVNMLSQGLSSEMAAAKKDAAEFLEKYVEVYYYDTPADIVEKRLFKVLEYIGFLSCTVLDGCSYITLAQRKNSSQNKFI
ncbi:hypothetical protein MM300_17330 [Evansella sp. LMS18]|uniref:hypothetical protein n=1 Tax=Evansella sp. LMS18 TaxID=2924033 RepID=UPI0020D1D980|nr:hypothetical protein [Evansella sp. LMS18]UTR09637.1 hypothetical protein MM300_17330 [Evansella sp. LMS18]